MQGYFPRLPARSCLLLLSLCLAAGAQTPAPAAPGLPTLQPATTPFEGIAGNSDLTPAAEHWQAGAFDKVLAVIRPLAEQGNAAAEFVLGGLYSQGQGVPQDDAQAAQWWQKAAEHGSVRAQNEIGVVLSDGRGVPVDQLQAVAWYRKAAEQGLAVAQANLGLMYWKGLGVRRDDRQAVAWFRKAAEQEFGWAQFYLGAAYVEGRGVGRNYQQAVNWLRKSAEQDYAEAQNAMGLMYFRGTGVSRDYASAVNWFTLAIHSGLETAESNLQFMLNRLPKIPLHAAIEIREKPAATAAVIGTAGEHDNVYELDRRAGWVEIYLAAGNRMGFVSTAQLRGK